MTTADPVLAELLAELSSYPGGEGPAHPGEHEAAGVAVPFRFTTSTGVLSLLSTTMMFGTPTDVTVSELAIETFLPADATTAAALRAMAAERALSGNG